MVSGIHTDERTLRNVGIIDIEAAQALAILAFEAASPEASTQVSGHSS